MTMTPAPISVERLPAKWRDEADHAIVKARDKNWTDWVREGYAGEARTAIRCANELEAVLPALLHQLAETERLEANARKDCEDWYRRYEYQREKLDAAERAREEAERDLRAIYEAVPGLPIYATEEDADRATDAFTAICHLCNDYIVSDASGGNTDG